LDSNGYSVKDAETRRVTGKFARICCEFAKNKRILQNPRESARFHEKQKESVRIGGVRKCILL